MNLPGAAPRGTCEPCSKHTSTKSRFPARLGLCQPQKGGREEQEILSIPVGCCKPPLFGAHSPFLAPDVVLLHRVAEIGVLRAGYDFGPLGVDVEGVAEPWGERRRIPSGRVLRCWGKALLWCGRPDPTGVILKGAEPPSTGLFKLARQSCFGPKSPQRSLQPQPFPECCSPQCLSGPRRALRDTGEV